MGCLHRSRTCRAPSAESALSVTPESGGIDSSDMGQSLVRIIDLWRMPLTFHLFEDNDRRQNHRTAGSACARGCPEGRIWRVPLFHALVQRKGGCGSPAPPY